MTAYAPSGFVNKRDLADALARKDRAAVAGYLLAIANIALACERLSPADRDDMRQELTLYMLGKFGRVTATDTAFCYLLTVARRRLSKLQRRKREKLCHRRVWERVELRRLITLQSRKARAI